jgi:protein-disulfide isomerase
MRERRRRTTRAKKPSFARTELTQLTMPVDTKRDHIQGPETAPITLVEYGDYECPYCGQAYPIIKEIQESLADRLRFVFRNFPMAQVHPYAENAAEAAEAAGAQGKFWEMHDYLYENQQALEDENLEEYASLIGLELTKFNQEMSLHAYAGRVREDFMSGVYSGVNGTPTFFINGIRYDGSWDYRILLATLKELLEEEETIM